MAIVRWEPFGRSMNPWQGFNSFRDRMERLFNEYLPEDDDVTMTRWVPMVDVSENGDHFTLHAEVPGMNKKDIKITLENDVLTISGQKDIKREDKNKTYHLLERSHGQFSRSFKMPAKVDASKIKAEFKDGVLDVTLPKVPEAKAREIQIEVD